jgi:hypothetical protein
MEQPLWSIILAILIPLIVFILLLRPFIRDSAVRAAGEVVRDVQRDVAGVRQDVAELRGQLKGLEPSLQAVRELSSWLQKHKLDELVKEQGPASKEKSGSLPPEKAARRDYLRDQASAYGLTEEDATELRTLLEEDARDDLARGLISLAAFVLILVGIGAVINSLSRR